MSEIEQATGRRLTVYRAILAGRANDLGPLFTVGRLRQFLKDCDSLGIPDETPVKRERPEAMFALDGAQFVAERVVDLDDQPAQETHCWSHVCDFGRNCR